MLFNSKNKFRYIKLIIWQIREPSVNCAQFSCIEFFTKAANPRTLYRFPASAICTAKKGNGEAVQDGGEGPSKAIDHSTNTKVCVGGNNLLPFIVDIDLGDGNFISPDTYTMWRLYTANDVPGRDPVTYTLAGSVDGQNYVLMDSVLNHTNNANRKSVLYEGVIKKQGAIPWLLASPNDFTQMNNKTALSINTHALGRIDSVAGDGCLCNTLAASGNIKGVKWTTTNSNPIMIIMARSSGDIRALYTNLPSYTPSTYISYSSDSVGVTGYNEAKFREFFTPNSTFDMILSDSKFNDTNTWESWECRKYNANNQIIDSIRHFCPKGTGWFSTLGFASRANFNNNGFINDVQVWRR